jgi:hypothetical protein
MSRFAPLELAPKAGAALVLRELERLARDRGQR